LETISTNIITMLSLLMDKFLRLIREDIAVKDKMEIQKALKTWVPKYYKQHDIRLYMGRIARVLVFRKIKQSAQQMLHIINTNFISSPGR